MATKKTSVLKNTMELLAPAGTTAAFLAALDAGADAVYVGAPEFNARALRKEISLEDIAAMTDFAKEGGKRLYVAMNSLVKEDETYRVLETLSILERINPHALIIQDLGLFHLARKHFPRLVLHASTLMSVHNRTAAEFLARSGFERVVLARELSLEDMKSIARRSKAQLEVFIHGAMCFSYSGLCLFSSLHGGKSSLRGRCVQPCRRQYRIGKSTGRKSGKKEQQGGFLFSMNDLAGIDYLQELDALGVVSLKIEGRLKPVEYVRNTVRAYRMCLDGMHADEQEKKRIHREAEHLLGKAMGRKSGSGFFDLSSQGVINPQHSGSAGVFVGQADSVARAVPGLSKGAWFSVRLKRGLKVGDRLRFQNEKDDIRESFTLKRILRGRQGVQEAEAGQSVMVAVPLNPGGRRGKVRKGLLFQVDTGERRKSEGRGGRTLKKVAREQVMPNRQQLEDIAKKICWSSQVDTRAVKPGKSGGNESSQSVVNLKQKPRWWIRLQWLPSAKQRYPVRPEKLCVSVNKKNIEYIETIGEQCTRLYPNLVWALPAVIHEKELKWYRGAIRVLLEAGFCAFQLGHISQAAFFEPVSRSGELLELYTDYTVNILNAGGVAYGSTLGLKGMLFSLETEQSSLQQTLASWKKQLSGSDISVPVQIGMYVYGKPPLFTARADAPHLRIRDRVISPKNESYLIERNEQLTLVRSQAPLVLLPHIQEMLQMGVSYFILDISNGPLKRELSELGGWLHGKSFGKEYMKGNYEMGLL